MNAIIALCHFCETHGPRIVFCTQAIHDVPEKGKLEKPENGQKEGIENASDVSSQSDCNTNRHHTETCNACQSVALDHPGYTSREDGSAMVFFSHQTPKQPELYTMLRDACLRSVSCEVCPGKEGPIFFGDDHRGHVLSYTFHLEDLSTRGCSRLYSIVILMRDKIYLLNSWPFLVSNLTDIVNCLQKQAQTRSEKNLPKPVRHPSARLQKASSVQVLSLPELLDDNIVFEKLHQAFTWLLLVGSSRLRECLYEGPPTEDAVVHLEQQEETEEGFVMLTSGKLNQQKTQGLELTPAVYLKEIVKRLGAAKLEHLVYHLVIGNQVIVRGNQADVSAVLNTLQVLLPRGCCRTILYSTVYEESWRCNLLGVPAHLSIPPHINQYVCLSIDGNWQLYLTAEQLPQPGPKIVEQLVAAILMSVPENILMHKISCIKEEWLNKVKVLFKFTRVGGQRSEEDTHKLMCVFGAQAQDYTVLKFWMTGLSVQYRNNMLGPTNSA